MFSPPLIMRIENTIFVFLFLIISSIKLFGQEPSGILGEPVINIDFNRGSTIFGPPVGNLTTYKYIAYTPNDGEYAIAKNTIGMYTEFDVWHQITNHTPNDPDGYMMIANASIDPGIVYQTPLSSLCPGTTYKFAAWILNLFNQVGLQPNITFQIETKTGEILKSYSTNNIPNEPKPRWVNYSTTFKVGQETDLILKIINFGRGGSGNDIAIDDITFTPYVPIVSQKINDKVDTVAYLCEDAGGSYKLEANVSPNYYINPSYQWQSNTGSGWNNINGAEKIAYTATFINPKPGTYQYRIIAAEAGNINTDACRTISPPFSIIVNTKADAQNSGTVCVGQTIQLFAAVADSYKWIGPGFSSTEKNPILKNATKEMAGQYILMATKNGCLSTDTTTVSVVDAVKVITNVKEVTICEGNSVELRASGGTSYQWTPTEGLSDPYSENPNASPKNNTIYRVMVSNGSCTEYADVSVLVNKTPIVSVGNDVKIVAGQSTKLMGKITGDYQYFHWTPSNYLDDPESLTPIATPPTDIKYTLTAGFQNGCDVGSDDVAIEVLPKIIVPNSFSPNGDGINDTWNIEAASSFPQVIVKILNRNGQLVFESKGPFKPWDGKLNGKDLPSAVYYYSIHFNNSFQALSGWINLLL